MKLEVKNIKHARSLSQETNAFSADLFVDGEKISTCANRGEGGMTFITPLFHSNEVKRQHYRDTLEKAERFAQTLPAYQKLKMSLDFYVDLEVDKDLSSGEVKRAIKNLDKKCLNNIVIISQKALDDFKSGKTTSLPHKLLGWKRPIADMPVEVIKKQLPAVKLQLKGDEFIYNKNLPE